MWHSRCVRHVVVFCRPRFSCFFFFNDTATTEIYTLSLHDALPISHCSAQSALPICFDRQRTQHGWACPQDRKSTRLNSSHQIISYAVFCLKKKKNKKKTMHGYNKTRRRPDH